MPIFSTSSIQDVFGSLAELAACNTPLQQAAITQRLELYFSKLLSDFSIGVDMGGQLYMVAAALEKLVNEKNIVSAPENVITIISLAGVFTICFGISNSQTIHTHDLTPSSATALTRLEALRKSYQENPITGILMVAATAASIILITDTQSTPLAILSVLSLTDPFKDILFALTKNKPGSLRNFAQHIIKFCQHKIIQALCRASLVGAQSSIAAYSMINMYNAGQTNNYSASDTKNILISILSVGMLWGFFIELLRGKMPRTDIATDIICYAFRAIYGIFTAVMAVAAVRNPEILSSAGDFNDHQPGILTACIILLIPSILSYIQYSYYHVGLQKLNLEFNSVYLKQLIARFPILTEVSQHIGKKVLIIILKTFIYFFYTIFWFIAKITGLGVLAKTHDQNIGGVWQELKIPPEPHPLTERLITEGNAEL